MKKVLASALALTMVTSLTSVALATTTTTDATGIKVDDSSKIYLEDDNNILTPFTGSDLLLKPGSSLYVELLPEGGSTITSKLAGQYKMVLDWNQGKDMVDSFSIQNKKVNAPTGAYLNTTPSHGLQNKYGSKTDLEAAVDALKKHDDVNFADHDSTGCTDEAHKIALDAAEKTAIMDAYKAEVATSYRYVAGIKVKSSFNVKQLDLLGTVKIAKKSASGSAVVDSKAMNLVVGYDKMDASVSSDVNNDSPVVTFENVDDEVELMFGSNASFTVNGRNQGDVYLGFSNKPNTAIIDQNEDANIEFITFEGKPTFNRMGDLRLFFDKDSYIYELTGKGLKKVDAKYDSDSEAFVLETRNLGAYVISDVELKYTAVDNGDDSSSSGSNSSSSGSNGSGSGSGSGSTGGSTNNPNTGAGAMAGIAMGLAGLSVVAGAASKKSSKK